MSADSMIGPSQKGRFPHPRGHPPAGADPLPSCLLSRTVYIDDLTNGTTAVCRMTDGGRRDVTIQVTLVVAHPPRISSFFAHCNVALFTYEPVIVDTEGQSALLYMCVGKPRYYVYQSDGGSKGMPSLTLLPHPNGLHLMERDQVGLLNSPSGHYFVAALLQEPASAPGQMLFNLYLYDSNKRTWTVKTPFLPEDQQKLLIQRGHHTHKVITIGGDRGTMGFVDLSQGILFCDVLGECPNLHYVSLPPPMHPSRLSRPDPFRVSDVAVDTKGHIKFIELYGDIHGWEALLRRATTDRLRRKGRKRWSPGHRLLSSQLVRSDLEPPPNVPVLDGHQHSEALPIPDFRRDYIELPTLSLHDDNTVYFLTRRGIRDWDGWVIAVDMASKKLQAAAQYYTRGRNPMFRHSRISNNLCMTSTLGNQEHTEIQLLESASRRKQPLPKGSYWVGELEQHPGTIIGAEDEDT